VPPELTFIIVTGIVAALLGIGALVAVVRERALRAQLSQTLEALPDRADALTKYDDAELLAEGAAGAASYGAAVRILWWISIAAVLVGVGLTDAFADTQPAVYALGAVAVGVAVVLHDLLPQRWRTPAVSVLEVLAALALATVLLTLTGYGRSPFVYAYGLVAVAVSLALGPRVALGVTALATISYLAVLALDPALPSYGGDELLRVGLSIGSVWLLAYLAGVFAAGERRMRTTVLQLSRIDSLTGLMNRGQLFPMLDQEVKRTRRSERGFCLLMIDLDGLKAVNDSFGHHRGDDVLRRLGGVIRRSIRAVDTAYRYGGDEFLVLLPETDFAGAFVVAEKVRAGAEEVGLAVGGGELLTSVSIGLVSCPEDGTSAEELMIAVDRAMYQAKALGKNQISGNPRPRRIASGTEPGGDEVAALHVEVGGAEPVMTATAASATMAAASAQSVQAEPPPFVARGAVPATNGAHDPAGDDEPDPSEVRRHIAAARLNLDPDHQIRRAMDAFLSPPSRRGGDD